MGLPMQSANAAAACHQCGHRLTLDLDLREWATVDEFASERGMRVPAVRSWIATGTMHGLLRLSPWSIRVNRYRFGALVDRRVSDSGSVRVDAVCASAARIALPCPACAADCQVDRSHVHIVTTSHLAKYLRLTLPALRKRNQRGQLPPSLRVPGRTLYYDAAEIQRYYRVTMLATEIGAV